MTERTTSFPLAATQRWLLDQLCKTSLPNVTSSTRIPTLSSKYQSIMLIHDSYLLVTSQDEHPRGRASCCFCLPFVRPNVLSVKQMTWEKRSSFVVGGKEYRLHHPCNHVPVCRYTLRYRSSGIEAGRYRRYRTEKKGSVRYRRYRLYRRYSLYRGFCGFLSFLDNVVNKGKKSIFLIFWCFNVKFMLSRFL